MHRTTKVVWTASSCLFLLLAAAALSPAQVNFAEYSTLTASSNPQGITKGPDAAVWFVETGTSTTAGRIGRISAQGKVTEYALVNGAVYAWFYRNKSAGLHSCGVGVQRQPSATIAWYFTLENYKYVLRLGT